MLVAANDVVMCNEKGKEASNNNRDFSEKRIVSESDVLMIDDAISCFGPMRPFLHGPSESLPVAAGQDR
jgi:hypothetical protein